MSTKEKKESKKEIKEKKEQELVSTLSSLIERLSSSFPLAYSIAKNKKISISFEKLGIVAGTCDSQGNIEINEALPERYPNQCQEVIAHELAHCLTNTLHSNAQGHSKEWERMMKALGFEPKAHHNFDLEDLRLKTQKMFTYKCFCTTHNVSMEKHKEIKKNGAICKYCDHSVIEIK